MNFDGSVRMDGSEAGFIIYSSDGRLLAASGSHLFELSVPTAELHAALPGVTFARQQLHAE